MHRSASATLYLYNILKLLTYNTPFRREVIKAPVFGPPCTALSGSLYLSENCSLWWRYPNTAERTFLRTRASIAS